MRESSRASVGPFSFRHLSLGLVLLCGASGITAEAADSADDVAVIHASVQALTNVMVHDIFSPPQASRAYAYSLVAYYEALRHQDPTFRSYAGQLNELHDVPQPQAGASYDWLVAGTRAFLRVAEEMVFSQPRFRAATDEIWQQHLTSRAPEDVQARSEAYGELVAQHILAWSREDRYSATRSWPRYAVASKEPGAWEPTPPAYMDAVEPYWGRLRPFALRSGDQFLIVRPSPFDTTRTSAFFDEIVGVHRAGMTLTPEQREVAAFWDCNPFVVRHQGHLSFGMKKITPGGHWIGITRIAVDESGDGPARAAAAYSLVAVAVADGFIAAWDEKYRSNRVRPETVIRRHLDPDWQPILQTPPFPEYPSAHSVISRAAAIALTGIYGKSFAYTDDVEESFGLAPRRFNSFLEAADEAAMSRLYGGIHYLPAVEAGQDLGRQIGEWIVNRISLEDEGSARTSTTSDIEVSWGVSDNLAGDGSYFTSVFRLQNKGTEPFGGDWTAYFNFGRRINPASVPPSVRIHHLNGDFYRLEPTDAFQRISPGDSMDIPFEAASWAIKEVDAPAGFYFVPSHRLEQADAATAVDVRIQPFVGPKETSRGSEDELAVPTAASRYADNEQLRLLPPDSVGLVVPTPRQIQLSRGSWILSGSSILRYERGLASEARYIVSTLEPLLGRSISAVEAPNGAQADITLQLAEDASAVGGAEGYRLSITPEGGVQIEGGSPAGVFYGIQSFRALISPDAYRQARDSIEVLSVEIVDKPRFSYRGMHLDVARNFQPKQRVEKLLDLMAFYKLNRFHIHLTEDEAWRLEIPSLPELTRVGSRRGHTLDEADRLVPSFGSGPYADVPPGSGHYTRDEFMDLLRYAQERHIMVIPEIDLPGHARAAIKSMEARFRRLDEAGRRDPSEHRLRDPDDVSQYRSVQGWDDNVVNVCQESTYRFVELVIDELVAIYRDAGAPLTTVHVGGDEVPPGVWTGSPACAELVASSGDLHDAVDLFAYFKRRVIQILEARGLATAGWEEIALHERHEEQGTLKEPDLALAERNVVPYFWTSVWGWGAEDLGYRLANAGFKVIFSNASNLYFDMAYDKDPEEPGYYWAAFINTKNVYEFEPHDLYGSARMDQMGRPISRDAYDDRVRLTDKGEENIVGIQGQLWGETLVSPERMEYMALPRMVALAERAWADRPDWAFTADRRVQERQLNEAWTEFANRLGQREMPRLDYIFGGSTYRLPPPGARIQDGRLLANVEFPGLAIHYSTDGSDPTVQSPRYTEPVPVSGEVRLRSLDSRGRGSRVIVVAP